MQAARAFDLVLFGATGFTGQLTAQYLAAAAPELRWALAGRNRDKLAAVRDRLTYHGAARPELITADAADAVALAALAANTRVVITTVGPYIQHGEPLLAACARAGTDYVDLTGEPLFVERMASRYHALAVSTGAKIINACGFDSLPHDLGVLFTVRALEQRVGKRKLPQLPVSIDAFVRATGQISGGTWQSMLLIMSEYSPFASKPTVALPGRRVQQVPGRVRFQRDLGLWSVPAPTIDPDIVCRSAELLERYGSDFRYGHYLGLKHWPQVAGLLAATGTLFGLSKSRHMREWLGKLRPSGVGPTEEQRSKGHFRVIFRGRAGDQHVHCEVRGGDPGYGETAKMLAESALCLVQDRARLPAQCGVVTSAAAFGEVLIERLSRAGIVFEDLTPAAEVAA